MLVWGRLGVGQQKQKGQNKNKTISAKNHTKFVIFNREKNKKEEA